MRLCREIEIVNRGQQEPCLANDLKSSAAVSSIRRPKVLSLDDLGESDNGIEWRLDLMDKLAERGRVSKDVRNCLGFGSALSIRCTCLADGNPTIAREATIGGIKRRHSANLPLSRRGTSRGDRHQSVAERSTQIEGPNNVVIDVVTASLDGLSDRTANQRAAWHPVDPGDLAAWSTFPAEQRRRLELTRRWGGRGNRFYRAHTTPLFDALDNVVHRRRNICRVLRDLRLAWRLRCW